MGIVRNLAVLFCVFGVAQVYSGEYKSEDIERRTYDVDCFKKAEGLVKHLIDYIEVLNEVKHLKELGIDYGDRLIELINKCGCEKECEDKKCQEELEAVLNKIHNLLAEYIDKVAPVFLKGLDTTSLYSTWALGELRCCCNKIETCIKKIESFEVKHKGHTKECKPNKCNKGISELQVLLPEYIEMLATSLLDIEQLIKKIEELLKHKSELIKDSKCGDEKYFQTLADSLGALKITVDRLNSKEQVMYIYDKKGKQLTYTAAKERKECK